MITGRFSLEPDEHMRWIYDFRHPDYNSDRARNLRDRRAAALRSCPQWMLDDAALNDEMARALKRAGYKRNG